MALTEKQKALGWREGTIGDFMGLSDAQAAMIEVKVLLAARLREKRVEVGLSQQQLAERLGTRQPAVARLESASRATVHALLRALLECGATLSDVAEVLREAERNLPEVQKTPAAPENKAQAVAAQAKQRAREEAEAAL